MCDKRDFIRDGGEKRQGQDSGQAVKRAYKRNVGVVFWGNA
jgi:hypothetical protein